MTRHLSHRARRPWAVCLTLACHVGIAWAALACGEPTRPIFNPSPFDPDTFPPRIEFLEPAVADSVYAPGSQIVVRVRVSDRTTLSAVAAGVLGAFALGFPNIFPNDTVLVVDYPIPTPVGVTGQITLRIVATDSLDNRASADRSFVLQ
jgi:hypothetical protein